MSNNAFVGPVLVTGGSGFVGANLVRRAVSEGADVHLFLRDSSNDWRLRDLFSLVTVHRVSLTDRSAVADAIGRIRPRRIFHLAAYGAYPFQTDVDMIHSVNLQGTMNLVDACVERGFDSFVYTGSSSEYGFKKEPMKEADVLEPNSYYAVFKAAATHYCQYVARSKQVPIRIARLFSAYGPYEEPTRLIPTLLSSLREGRCPPLVHPETARDYIYVDDVVDACFALAHADGLIGELFNIGSGRQTTLKELFEIAKEAAGASVDPVWGTMAQRIWDQPIWQSDVSKIRNALDWKARTELKEGLCQTFDWMGRKSK